MATAIEHAHNHSNAARHLNPDGHPQEMHHHSHEDHPVTTQKKKRNWRSVLILLILVASISLLIYYHINTRNSRGEKQEANALANEGKEMERPGVKFMNFVRTMLGFEVVKPEVITEQPTVNIHATQSENTRMAVTENSDSMLKLAIGLRDAGMKLKGVSQCRYTQIQREAFGGRTSEARRVIESIYTECRSRDMCPNIRGYPTWTLNDRQWPGNRSANALRAMLTEAQTTNLRPMFQGPSEPTIELVPDAQHAEQTGDEELSAETAASLLNRIKAKEESDDYDSAIAEVEANRIAVINSVESESKKSGGVEATVSGMGIPTVAGGFMSDNETTTTTTTPPIGVIKENVRGVSNFAPLNVPDMPGTAPFVLRQEQHDDQTRQGNAPRASSENNKPTLGVTQQHISAFAHEEAHVSTRNINADSYSTKRFPHASDITTGEAFADKTVVYEKN